MSGDKRKGVASLGPELTFAGPVGAIGEIHQRMVARAGHAVNISLTTRSWLIVCCIEEYERRGVDRAEYGEKLADELAAEQTRKGLSNCNRRELYRYRQSCLVYPQIVGAVTPQFVAG